MNKTINLETPILKEFILETQPIPASRPRVSRYGTYYSKTYETFKTTLKMLFKTKFNREFRGGEMNITFLMEMPKSWGKKKRDEMCDQYHTQKPDIDNLIKAVLDGLLEDDSIIYKISAEKVWSERGKIVISWWEKSE